MYGRIFYDLPPFQQYFNYKDDERLVMKAVCNGTSFTVEKNSPQVGLELQPARSAGQRLTLLTTRAPCS